MKQTVCALLLLALLLGAIPTVSASAQGIEKTDDGNFTILWTSDPQWYSFAYQEILTHQNDWVAENYERLGIEYIVHTGDFVDLPHNADQWSFVTEEYRKWDDAGIPYGVLAGNHDVDGTDYTEFSLYFGEERFVGNAWYGESYKDNKGHYDLMTMGGVDFIFVYMGYGTPTQEDLDWLNSVLAEHADRIAFLGFHEFLDANGNRTAVGNTYFEQVVLKNANVRMVMCGHNYNATRRTDSVDDNGDGTADRTVYQIMANYQDTPKGGNGYMRFMECDVESGQIICRTYSPYLDDFNYFANSGSAADIYGYRDEFTLPFDFSAPTASNGEGKTVDDPWVAFGIGEETVALPLDYVNQKASGDSFAGLYDHTYSMTSADITDADGVTYIHAEYDAQTGYTVTSIRSDCSAISERSVVVALRGTELPTVQVGQTVAFSRVEGLASPAAGTHIKLYLYDTGCVFGIDGADYAVSDRSQGDTASAGSLAALFTFAPLDGHDGVYTLVSASTAYGERKSAEIPEGGFALTVSLSGCTDTYRQSLADTFRVGASVALSGYTPGEGIVYEGVSILSKSPDDWTFDSSVMAMEQTDDGISLYNNNGLWPDGQYILREPVTFDPSAASLYYDFTVENGGKTSILLFFGGSTPSDYRSDQYLNINAYFAGVTISESSGDIKGDGTAATGTVSFADLPLPAGCYNQDGTVTISGIKIYACGTANLTTTYRELRVIADSGEPVWPEYTPVKAEDTSTPSEEERVGTDSSESEEQPHDGSVLLYIAIGVIAIAVVAVAAVLLRRKKKHSLPTKAR